MLCSTLSSAARASSSSVPTAPVRSSPLPIPICLFGPQNPETDPTTPRATAHDISAKKGKGNTAAGVFTQPYALGYVLTALEEGIARGDITDEAVTDQVLSGFLSEYGRAFYSVPKASRNVLLRRGRQTIPEFLKGDGAEIVPFRAGETTWSVEWQ